MSGFSNARAGFVFAALLASMTILGGCSGTKYIYDPATNFSGFKTYAWTPASYIGRRESLVAANVQFVADRVLEQKGIKKTSENPDLLIAIETEYELGSYSNDGYQLRTLTLKIYQRETKEIIWRGTAPGTINTDAASGDLKSAVESVLSKFPPK